MVTLKGVATLTVVIFAALGIRLAPTALPKPETTSLLLLGVGMIGTAMLLRLQISGGNKDEVSSAQEQALVSKD